MSKEQEKIREILIVKNSFSGYEVRKAKNNDLCIMLKKFNIRIATFSKGREIDAEVINKILQQKNY